jgi:hypothetical protein
MAHSIGKKLFRGGWRFLAAAVFTLTCEAYVSIDQSFVPPQDVVRLDTQVGIAPFFAGAQTFTPRLDGQLGGFDFWIQALGGEPLTSQLRVQVQTTTAQGRPSGKSLGAVLLPASFLFEQSSVYKHIAMDGLNVSLRADELYAAVFQAVPFISGGNAAYDFRGYSKSQLGGDYSYNRGQGLFSEDGQAWREYAGADFDYVFRTYMIVPEPRAGELMIWAGLLFCAKLLFKLLRRWFCQASLQGRSDCLSREAFE